jgi:DNA-directed RNA polymerase specialized sigma24 family protein
MMPGSRRELASRPELIGHIQRRQFGGVRGDLADDLRQATVETLLRRSESRGDALDPSYAWLEIRSAMLDAYREQIQWHPIRIPKTARDAGETIYCTDDAELIPHPSPDPSPLDVVEDREACALALAEVDERARRLVVAFEVFGIRVVDAAAHEGISGQRAKQVIDRARLKMGHAMRKATVAPRQKSPAAVEPGGAIG